MSHTFSTSRYEKVLSFNNEWILTKQLLRKIVFNKSWTTSSSVSSLIPFSKVAEERDNDINQYNNRNVLNSSDDEHDNSTAIYDAYYC